MELTKQEIKKQAKIFGVSEVFIVNLLQEVNTMEELQKILYELPEFANENELPQEIAEITQVAMKTLSNVVGDSVDMKFGGVAKIPPHNCPLNENEKDCGNCPLNPNYLIPLSIKLFADFKKETNSEFITLQDFLDIFTYEMSNNPDKLRFWIKEGQKTEKEFKDKNNGKSK